MNNNILRQLKKSLSVVMAAALIITGCVIISTDSKAAEGTTHEETDGVRYVEYDAADCKLGTAPEYSKADENYGYVFGGWYKSSDGEYVAIKQEESVTDAKVFAKYVPAYVLSVKCQNFAGTTQESDSTALRIMSSIDSLDYQRVGFDLMKIVKNGESYTMTTIGQDGTQETTKTYAGFDMYNKATDTSPAESFTPQQIFGDASEYLTAWKINKISKANFGTIICIRPYWVTMDGTTVYGLAKYAHVEDGYLEYINVPVNLNNKEGVAAGLLSVGYNSTDLQFVDAEYGRVFEEMEWADDGAGKVKFVGNAKDVMKNTDSDDIYVNLRFKLKEGSTNSAFDFAVDGESFTNSNETLLEGADYNVWNVKAAILK